MLPEGLDPQLVQDVYINLIEPIGEMPISEGEHREVILPLPKVDPPAKSAKGIVYGARDSIQADIKGFRLLRAARIYLDPPAEDWKTPGKGYQFIFDPAERKIVESNKLSDKKGPADWNDLKKLIEAARRATGKVLNPLDYLDPETIPPAKDDALRLIQKVASTGNLKDLHFKDFQSKGSPARASIRQSLTGSPFVRVSFEAEGATLKKEEGLFHLSRGTRLVELTHGQFYETTPFLAEKEISAARMAEIERAFST